MNCLNSIILEGYIESVTKEENKSTIKISVLRDAERDGHSVIETSVFEAVAYGTLAEYVAKHTDSGRGLRVVGRLASKACVINNIGYDKVYIVAEHIEFKPKFKEVSNVN